MHGSRTACGSIGLMRQQEDWYAYLNIATDTPTEQIAQAVERLSRQATALAVTAPERSQRLRDTVRSIKRDLLSGPEARARYDAEREAVAAPPPELPSQIPPSQMPPPPVSLPASATIPPPPPVSLPASATIPPPPPTAVPPTPSYSPSPVAPTSPATGGPYGGGPAGGPGGGPAVGGPGGGPGVGGPGVGRPGGGGPGGGERISARLVRFLRTGWVCAECGKEALPSDKFCTRCGTVISPTRHEPAPVTRVTCVNCAASVGVNDAFCARCGTRVSK